MLENTYIFTNLKEFGYLLQLILWDSLEGTFHFNADGTGSDYEIEKYAQDSFVTHYCLRVATRKTTPAAGDYVTASRRIQLQPANYAAFGCAFKFLSATLVDKIKFKLSMYISNVLLEPELIYDVQNTKWTYINSAGVETDVPGETQNIHAEAWHVFLFIIDISNQVHLRAYCDTNTISTQNLTFPVGATAIADHLLIELRIETAGAAKAEALFDNFLILRD